MRIPQGQLATSQLRSGTVTGKQPCQQGSFPSRTVRAPGTAPASHLPRTKHRSLAGPELTGGFSLPVPVAVADGAWAAEEREPQFQPYTARAGRSGTRCSTSPPRTRPAATSGHHRPVLSPSPGLGGIHAASTTEHSLNSAGAQPEYRPGRTAQTTTNLGDTERRPPSRCHTRPVVVRIVQAGGGRDGRQLSLPAFTRHNKSPGRVTSRGDTGAFIFRLACCHDFGHYRRRCSCGSPRALRVERTYGWCGLRDPGAA